MPLEHRKLDVYSDALAFGRELERIAQQVPHYRYDLRDQMRRACASIVLNIAEGADEFSPAEKARIYRIARRSAAECIAVLDMIEHVAQLPAETRAAREAGEKVLAKMTNMVKAAESRKK